MQMMIVVPVDKQPDDFAVERDAFGAFFGEHYERLGRAMYLLTGDIGEAEDLAQDAMVRIYERWDRVGSMDSPEGYLYRTAMNLYRSRVRRAAVRLRRGPAAAPEDPLGASEDRDDIGRLLRSLPVGQREALVLVEWLGLGADEVATILGIEPSSVRARVSRAKAALRSDRAPDGSDES
jgi:RNA polymerase sigma-70 factor (ECF subfamily)